MQANAPDEFENLLRVFLTLHPTKELPRQGFIYFGFKRTETDSVASHSFCVASLAYLLAHYLERQGRATRKKPAGRRTPKVDPSHVLELALVHDWHEAVTGDVGYYLKLRSKAIDKIEQEAFGWLVGGLGQVGSRLRALSLEYSEGQTTASRIVRFADALDALAQGVATPSAQMDAFVDYNDRTYKRLRNDPVWGDELAELFMRASRLISQGRVGSLRPYEQSERGQVPGKGRKVRRGSESRRSQR